jgi:hypothetical protein
MVYSVFIPIGLLFVPWLLVRYVFATKETRQLPYLQHAPYLWVAIVVWYLALVLPNPPWSQTDTFTMHATGGAVATILFFYAAAVYRLKFANVWIALAAVYFFVSGLGVLNEILEFLLDTFVYEISNYDTWWDLVANTIGGIVAFMVFRLVPALRKHTNVIH